MNSIDLIKKYPSESFYSYISRLYRYLGSPKILKFNQEYFNRPKHFYNLIIPTRLEIFLKRCSVLTFSIVVKEMTLIPFYSNFISETELDELFIDMKGNGTNFCSILKFNVQKNLKNEILYCPECINEDIEKFGECYIHREHYLPGITTCFKHHFDLETYSVLENKIFTTPTYLNPEELDPTPSNPIQIRLAGIAYRLLNEKLLSPNMIRLKIKERLRVKRYFVGNKINYKKISEDLINKYGITFLEENRIDYFNLNIKSRNWLTNIIRSQRKLDPFIVIFLIDFLFDSLENFLKYEVVKDQNEVNNTYACINKACSSFNKDDHIKTYHISDGLNNSRDIVICEKCRMIYSVKTDKKVIIQYGEVWDKKLRELKDQGLPNCKIGDLLGIDGSNIPKHLEKKDHSNIDQKIVEAKEVLQQCEEITKTQFERIYRKQYRTLFHYDRSFLETYPFYKGEQSTRSTKYLKTEQEDQELLEKIKVVHPKLLNQYPCIRINKINILKECGFKRVNSLRNYHRSNEYIESIIETTNDYYIRYGISAIKYLRNKGINEITRSNLAIEMNDKRRLYDPSIWNKIKEYL